MPTVLTKDIMTIVEQDGRSLTVLDRYNNLIVNGVRLMHFAFFCFKSSLAITFVVGIKDFPS